MSRCGSSALPRVSSFQSATRRPKRPRPGSSLESDSAIRASGSRLCTAETTNSRSRTRWTVPSSLAENAVMHGIAAETDRIHVEVRIQRAPEGVELSVRNTAAEAPETGVKLGVGLGNTRERLETLYGGDHEFTLTHEMDGSVLARRERRDARYRRGNRPHSCRGADPARSRGCRAFSPQHGGRSARDRGQAWSRTRQYARAARDFVRRRPRIHAHARDGRFRPRSPRTP